MLRLENVSGLKAASDTVNGEQQWKSRKGRLIIKKLTKRKKVEKTDLKPEFPQNLLLL